MCTKHTLKHPCPPMVNYFPGKDSEYILVFKFKPAPEKTSNQNLLWLAEPLARVLEHRVGGSRALIPGGNAVLGLRQCQLTPSSIGCPQSDNIYMRFSLGKHEVLC